MKNIADPDERARAQIRSEGPSPREEGDRTGGIVKTAQRRSRPGTFLLETGYQVEGEDGLPVAAMSSNVGGMAAHWTGACPRPNDSERIGFLDEDGELDELLTEAERLLGSPAMPSTRLPTRHWCVDGWPRPRTTVATRTRVFSGCRSRCTVGTTVAGVVGLGRRTGRRTSSQPELHLFDGTLVTRVIVEDGRAAGVR